MLPTVGMRMAKTFFRLQFNTCIMVPKTILGVCGRSRFN